MERALHVQARKGKLTRTLILLTHIYVLASKAHTHTLVGTRISKIELNLLFPYYDTHTHT